MYLAARSEARAKAAIAELLAETGKEAIWLELDLSSLQSVERAAVEFHRYGVVIQFPSLRADPRQSLEARKSNYIFYSTMRTNDHVRVDDFWNSLVA